MYTLCFCIYSAKPHNYHYDITEFDTWACAKQYKTEADPLWNCLNCVY